MSETITLDPQLPLITDRVELDITDFIRYEGVDYGDAQLEQYMAEAQYGQLPVDSRTPNRLITLPLRLLDFDDVTFDEIRNNIQAKAALFQREGGLFRRHITSGFAVQNLYADVVGATLKMGGSSLQALGQFDIDAVLTLETLPDWYGELVTGDDHVETNAPELVFVEQGVLGAWPARVRLTVDNDDATHDQRSLIWGFRCRHYDPAPTARLAYSTGTMTPQDVALATAPGPAGVGILHNTLGANWTPVVATDLVVGGALTHTGTYQVWLEVSTTSAAPPQVRLIWDVGDLTLPVENAPVRIPGTGDFYDLKLGEIRIDKAPIGTHRWTGVVQAKGDVGGESVSTWRMWLQPIDEGAGVLRASLGSDLGLGSYAARDEFNQAAGALVGKTLPVGGTWAGAGDADDFAVEATGHTAQRTATGDAAGTIATGHVGIAGATAYAKLAVQVDCMRNTLSNAFASPSQGVVLRYADINNFLTAYFFEHPTSGTWQLVVAKVVGGTQTSFVVAATGARVANQWMTIRLLADAAGKWAAWLSPKDSVHVGEPVAFGTDSALATGGALATGKPGIIDRHTTFNAVTRDFDNFATWVPAADAVVFANQSVELRTDGIFREDSTGVAAGPLSDRTGGLPRLPASGLEDRPVEVFVRMSRGDLGQEPSNVGDDLSARVRYQPCWPFVPKF